MRYCLYYRKMSMQTQYIFTEDTVILEMFSEKLLAEASAACV